MNKISNTSFIAVLTLMGMATLFACSDSSDSRSGANGEEVSFSGQWKEHSCEMSIPEGLTEVDFSCGTFVVPANWDDPDGDRVGFEVAVLKSRNSPSEPDAFVFFGGGPGAWNLEGYLPTHATSVLEPIAQTRDIVFFDKRGNGLSRPSLFCPETFEQTQYAFSIIADASEHTAAILTGYQNCRTRLTGECIDLSNFNSYQVSADVAALMDALAYETYNLYGISYGGHEAQVMVRDHPEKIRSIILDSPAMPETSFAIDWPRKFDRSLNVMFNECDASNSCSTLYPDLRETLVDVMTRLNATPQFHLIRGSWP